MTQSNSDRSSATLPATKQVEPSSQSTSTNELEDRHLTEEEQRIEDMLDKAGQDSFPASDPPSWISRGVGD